MKNIFVAIALAIRIESKGSPLFRQRRVGRDREPFALLKFRSMYMNNDASVHKEWFENFYSGRAERHPTADDNGN